MRTVVGIDGSRASYEALRIAMGDASTLGLQLEVVLAWQTAPGAPPDSAHDREAGDRRHGTQPAGLEALGVSSS